MNSQQREQDQINFIKNLVSRRQDQTRVVSCLPLDRPGSSGSKLTDSSFGVRFGLSQNVTAAQRTNNNNDSSSMTTTPNSSRSVLGVFVQLRGVLQPPSLVAVDEELANEFLQEDQGNNKNNNSSSSSIISSLSWFFCPTHEDVRNHNFWTKEVDQTCDFQDSSKHHLPYALCYTGVQFGIPAQQLGDGRIVTLCETTTTTGKNNNNNRLCELQIKGGGIRTPYSRGLDGLLTLQSALKEFLLSKTLRKLKIPVAACVAVFKENGRECFRDPGNVGNVNQGRGNVNEKNQGYIDEEKDDDEDNNSGSSSITHPCGVLLRMTSSSIRVGTFEYLVKTQQWKLMGKLIKYLIRVHFSDENDENDENDGSSLDFHQLLPKFLKSITIRFATVVAKWQVNGFVHGVLNTDNISIVGETLDLATGCFIHYFDDDFVQNPDDVDNGGMYRFGRQPQKMFEACERLALLFYTFLISSSKSSSMNETFQETFTREMNREICVEKLGLVFDDDDQQQLFKDLSACVVSVLRKDKPEIDSFYESVWNLIRNPSHRPRQEEEENNKKSSSEMQSLIDFVKLHKNEFHFDQKKSQIFQGSREIPSLSTIIIMNNNDEIVRNAYQKAFSSAFPKIHKTFAENTITKRKLDDCGCG